MSTTQKPREGSTSSSPSLPDEMSPVHLFLKILPAEFQLAVDIEQGLVSLVYGPPGEPASHARIIRHQEFTPNAIRVLSVLLKESTYCPFEYLLAALHAPLNVLHCVLSASSASDILEFEELAVDFAERISESVPGEEREWLLRQMRRTMTEVTTGVRAFGISVFTLRTLGYRLQQVVHPQRARSVTRRKAFHEEKTIGKADRRGLISKAS